MRQGRARAWIGALVAAALLAWPAWSAARARQSAAMPQEGPLRLLPDSLQPRPGRPDFGDGRLRVCADPNNLPWSNARGEGFENRIAELMARDLALELEYTWWPQRRGFIRQTLNANRCDLVMGVPASYELTLRTRPYYRSAYMFVTRRGVQVRSLDDPALRRMRIGLHVMGDDYTNSPAEQSLIRRGLQRNVVGYSIYGDYSQPDPPAALVHAVATGAVDVAIVWGPLAGYFAGREAVPLALAPVQPAVDLPFIPYVYDIAIGLRHGDSIRRAMLDAELRRRAPEISAILSSYGVPLVGPPGD